MFLGILVYDFWSKFQISFKFMYGQIERLYVGHFSVYFNFFILYLKLNDLLIAIFKKHDFCPGSKNLHISWLTAVNQICRTSHSGAAVKIDIKIYLLNQATFLPSFIIFALKKNEL